MPDSILAVDLTKCQLNHIVALPPPHRPSVGCAPCSAGRKRGVCRGVEPGRGRPSPLSRTTTHPRSQQPAGPRRAGTRRRGVYREKNGGGPGVRLRRSPTRRMLANEQEGDLTETDIRTKFITPALDRDKTARWDLMTQIREEIPFTKGPRDGAQGKTARRGEGKRADYIPVLQNEPADCGHRGSRTTATASAGMQQALDYAEILDVPFAYSSNGMRFGTRPHAHKRHTVERRFRSRFPKPRRACGPLPLIEGLHRCAADRGHADYYDDGSRKLPRYYQLVAINRTVDAIARGEKRILLVMATERARRTPRFRSSGGCGSRGRKSEFCFWSTATFWRIRPRPMTLSRLASRADQDHQSHRRQVVRNLSGLYQAITGTEESQNIYKTVFTGLFDLVIVDECHRGSAASGCKLATGVGLLSSRRRRSD